MLDFSNYFFTYIYPKICLFFAPTSFFYLYLYPIICSLFAGFIFWVLFSFFPERARKKGFDVGITNDLITLNNLIFGYFDLFVRGSKHSPSYFQNQIHSCSFTEEDICLLLQNKISKSSFNIYPQYDNKMLVIGNEIIERRNKIDEVIKRLYSFNYFLSSKEIAILRSIHEKVFRYELNSESIVKIENIELRVVDPSLSYMTKVLLELQDDYRELRKILFNKKMFDRDFIISKIQAAYYSQKFKLCMDECSKWIAKNPFTSELQIAYKMSCLFALSRKNDGYTLVENLLTGNPDIISQRSFFYPLLSDPVAYGLITKKVAKEKVEQMKKISEEESIHKQALLASNAELKAFFASQGR